MEIWLDTVDLPKVEEAKRMGILFGVTTNPSLVSKSKLSMEKTLEQLLEIQPGPVTAQVTAHHAEKMIHQGEALYSFSNRLMVKVPVNPEGLKAISALSKSGIPVMATAVFDTNQALLAAAAGASYIAPYYSRICENDISGIEPMRAMMRMLLRYRFTAKVLGASLKTAEQVKECAEMGMHAVTLNDKVFSLFIEENPLTRQAVERFSKDWEKAPQCQLLPF